eukprot:GFYU01008336.1.p1 GENE.GFYU01008336.1~~GFYU01008336.1.p1  ORF type:complete len:373 (-),score=125.01 GFYU01008336.1:188-1306(-)
MGKDFQDDSSDATSNAGSEIGAGGHGIDHEAAEEYLQTHYTSDDVRNAFRSFDLDKNGFIGARELRHILISIGEEVTDEEVDEMISLVDNDGDGQISPAEFFQMCKRYLRVSMVESTQDRSMAHPLPGLGRIGAEAAKGQGGGGSGGGSIIEPAREFIPPKQKKKVGNLSEAPIQLHRSLQDADDQADYAMKATKMSQFAKDMKINGETLENIKARFNEADSDGSGEIDYEEFCEVLGVPPSEYVKKLFTMFDENHSNCIDLMEFVSGLFTVIEVAKEDKLKFAFQLFDMDGTGTLSKAEIQKVFHANNITNPKQVDSKVRDIYQMFDKNKDGHLTIDEFRDMAATFPDLLFPAHFLANTLFDTLGDVDEYY